MSGVEEIAAAATTAEIQLEDSDAKFENANVSRTKRRKRKGEHRKWLCACIAHQCLSHTFTVTVVTDKSPGQPGHRTFEKMSWADKTVFCNITADLWRARLPEWSTPECPICHFRKKMMNEYIEFEKNETIFCQKTSLKSAILFNSFSGWHGVTPGQLS